MADDAERYGPYGQRPDRLQKQGPQHGREGGPQDAHPASVAGRPTVTSVPGTVPPAGPGAYGYGPTAGAGGYAAPDQHHPYAAGPPYGQGQAPGHGYGYPGPYAWGTGAPLPQGMSTAAMVLGIVSLVLVMTLWGSFVAILTAPVALGLGIAARRKTDRGEQGGRSYATAGMVMGIIGTVISALLIVLLVLLITVWADEINDGDPVDDPYSVDAARTASAFVAAAR